MDFTTPPSVFRCRSRRGIDPAPPDTAEDQVARDDGHGSASRPEIFGSFALCPCHLPLTLWILVAVFGGIAVGAVLRDHVVVVDLVRSAAWIAGTWRGFRLVRLAQRGACRVPPARPGPLGRTR